MRARGFVLAATAVVVLAACGTTVPLQEQQSAGGLTTLGDTGQAGQAGSSAQAGSDGLGGAAATTSTSATGSSATQATAGTSVQGSSLAAGSTLTTPGATVTTRSGASPVPGSSGKPVVGSKPTAGTKTPGTKAGRSAAPSAAAASASGRGFTASTIDIGYSDSDISNYASTLGLKAVDTGSTPDQMKALADYIDAHGGILGRMIHLDEYTYSTAAQLANPDQAASEACAAWTQDDKDFAVVSSALSLLASGIQCMAAANTPIIDANPAGQTLDGEPTYAKYPNTLFSPGTFTAEKLAQLYVGMMMRTKYLTGWNTATGAPGSAPVKLGILVDSDPIPTYADNQIIAALKAAGYTIAPSDIITYDDNLSSATSQSDAAVLKFRTDGVTHVVTSDLQFAENAQSQKYFPRYAFADEEALYTGSYPTSQLAGAVAVSGTPAGDTTAANQPAVQNSTQALCDTIMTNAGQDITNLTALSLMEEECDEMFALANSLNAAGSISNAALQSGYESLGTVGCASTFVCVDGPLPGGHAAAQAIRDMTYSTSCTCFTYVDGVNHTS